MRRILIFLAIAFIATSGLNANGQGRKPVTLSTTASLAEKEEWDKIRKRYSENTPQISALAWRLIHTYRSETEMERGLKMIESIGLTLASNDPVSVRKFNGTNGIKQKLVDLMNSPDDTVSGFAAMMLAIVGDLTLAPRIAVLLDRQKDSPSDVYPPVTARGQAAIALGLLGAKQYAPRIALLLSSENRYDHSGAAIALGQLKATEYAGDVVRLLRNENLGYSDDDSPIYSLFQMGIAANYKREIAKVLDDEISGDRSVTAVYALARLGATEHSKDIAKLLKNDFRKGEAAKALALLGAREYTHEIVPLLEDEHSFNREDGALALGILGARDQAPAVAKLLKDPETWVQKAAAEALVIMEANEYARETLAIIAQQKEGPYFDASDFNSLVKEEAVQLDKRFMILLSQMKNERTRP